MSAKTFSPFPPFSSGERVLNVRDVDTMIPRELNTTDSNIDHGFSNPKSWLRSNGLGDVPCAGTQGEALVTTPGNAIGNSAKNQFLEE